jgi:HEAT repeat protein
MISTGVSTTLAQDAAKDAQKPPTGTGDDADEPAAAPKPAHDSPSVDLDTAWSMLTSATTNAKHPDLRIQGLAAVGTLGSSSRAAGLITNAMKDPDVDVRTSAVLAAGQTKNRALTTQLRAMLDDHEPQVAVAAASTLWKMGDHSGEDILVAVADGERKATAGLVDSARHTVSTDLHNPSTLAKIGALQGASLLLGPFGFGISAYEYIHKNGGQSARALAIELLAQEKTKPIHDELLSALNDKDVGVRAAALKALGEYHDKPTSAAIASLFYDPKSPVRLAAAAAYLRSTGAVAEVSGPKTSVRRSATKKS